MQRYENDKKYEVLRIFREQKMFRFYNFRNRCKSRGP